MCSSRSGLINLGRLIYAELAPFVILSVAKEVKLPLALAELGLIDEYELVVQPRLADHGPTLFAGLSKYVDLKLVNRLELGSGAVALRYEPRR